MVDSRLLSYVLPAGQRGAVGAGQYSEGTSSRAEGRCPGPRRAGELSRGVETARLPIRVPKGRGWRRCEVSGGSSQG